VAATQVMFWLFTYPVNQATQNWSVLLDNWLALREQWEYSHAASALLNLTAFIAVSALVVNGPAAERDEVTPAFELASSLATCPSSRACFPVARASTLLTSSNRRKQTMVGEVERIFSAWLRRC
jgi:hypothetical protein